MERQVLDSEELFEDHSVGPFTVACSLEIEHTECTHNGMRKSQRLVSTTG